MVAMTWNKWFRSVTPHWNPWTGPVVRRCLLKSERVRSISSGARACSIHTQKLCETNQLLFGEASKSAVLIVKHQNSNVVPKQIIPDYITTTTKTVRTPPLPYHLRIHTIQQTFTHRKPCRTQSCRIQIRIVIYLEASGQTTALICDIVIQFHQQHYLFDTVHVSTTAYIRIDLCPGHIVQNTATRFFHFSRLTFHFAIFPWIRSKIAEISFVSEQTLSLASAHRSN